MAVLYGDDQERQELFEALKAQRIYVMGRDSLRFDKDDKVAFLNFKLSKGLEFPLVVIMGGRIAEQAQIDAEAAKLLYVAMTRATEHLVMTVVENTMPASTTCTQSPR